MFHMETTVKSGFEAVGRSLGWSFDSCGAVGLLGRSVLAFVGGSTKQAQGSHWLPAAEIHLAGVVLFSRGGTRRLVEAASEFAGYCPRAVLLPHGTSVSPDVRAWAAMLDVGVVLDGAEPAVLLPAGPRVSGTVFSTAEWELLDCVADAVGVAGSLARL